MKIESLSPRPDRAGRYLVRFEGGRTMRLYRQTVEDFCLAPGLELSELQMQKLEENAGAISAKMRAVRIVSASSVSRKDLQQRLVRKGESEQQAREAVEWMLSLNLVDDRQTAQQLVRRCAARGYGAARAKQMLFEKQIPRELWDEVLEDYPDQTDAVYDFLQARLAQASDPKSVRRATDALLRRGHSWETIRRALSRLKNETEIFLEEPYG